MTAPIVPSPWLRDAAEVAAEAGTDVKRGLDRRQAADRLARYGPNQLR